MSECMYCTSEIPKGSRIDTLFCSNRCKDTYHNTRKRIEARTNKALKAIADIRKITRDEPTVYVLGRWALRDLRRALEKDKLS